MAHPIHKAVIPVAGFGTRFLPATKAMPKEMLPVVDKPVIQYIVEEAVDSGIDEVVLVTGSSKRAIEDHFDSNFELEYRLQEKKKLEALEEVRAITNMANFSYVRQPTPLGDGHAILSAQNIVEREPFAVLFGDDIIDSETPVLKEMIAVYEKYNAPVILVEDVPKEMVGKYGIVEGTQVEEGVTKAERFVEKPEPGETDSTLGVIGHYIVTPDLFEVLKSAPPGKDNEIRLADAFIKYLEAGNEVYTMTHTGTRFDCGNKLEYLKANIHYAMKSEDFRDGLQDYMKTMM
ncbi:MAG: UTP--glucose-1-phosphate uridylyltransferase GalU [Candidatus Andersenbacteria bacterium]|nr:UTP--glucose-1-phosphate uridylyltransferase GalU [Candidatus Andersenbacteria bacterium]